MLAVVQTVAGDGKPYLLHTGWWRPGQTSRADRPRSPRPAHASTAELRDARLIVARELGFPTWLELVAALEKARRDDAERQEERRRLRPEAEALLAGDAARLARLTAGQADTLLQMLAMRELLGTKLGEGLGVPRAAVDVLIGKATSLDLPLPRPSAATGWSMCACCSVSAPTPAPGPTASRRWRAPSILAARRWSTLLAEHGIVPRALWTYAACGRLDLVRAYGPTPRCRDPTRSTSPRSKSQPVTQERRSD
ncbi:MAG: hypothetical protein ACTHM9_08150 [Gemmatimonadales bacterium]